jgi:hypothetical protein
MEAIMKKIKFYSLSLATMLIFSIGLLDAGVRAQSISLRGKPGNWVSGEFFRPSYESFGTLKLSGWILALGVKANISERVAVLAELPYANGKLDAPSNFFSNDASQSTIANPYLGLEFFSRRKHASFELGVRLPVADENKALATQAGFLSDLERFDAFFPDILTINGLLNVNSVNSGGFAFRLRGGPNFWIFTNSDNAGDDVELLFKYSGELGYDTEQLSLSAGISGLLIATESDLDLGERTLHQFIAAAAVGLGNVRPGIQFRLPLDEDTGVDYVLGANVAIRLGK